MRCKRLDDLLPGYLDGDLPRRLNQQVSDHLDGCERCRRELQAQHRALRSLEVAHRPISIDLWADFSRRLQTQAPPRPSPLRLLWQPGLAAAIAAAVVALVTVTAPKPASTSLAAPPMPFERVAALPDRPSAAPVRIKAGAERGTALLSHVPEIAPRWRSEPPRSPAVRHPHRRPALRSRRLAASSAASHASGGFLLARGPQGAAGGAEMPAPLAPRDRPVTAARSPIILAAAPAPDGFPSVPEDQAGAEGEGQAGAGSPIKVAEGLVSVEQSAATNQMKGELLRLAREVARLGGDEASSTAPTVPTDEPVPGDRAGSSASSNPAGT